MDKKESWKVAKHQAAQNRPYFEVVNESGLSICILSDCNGQPAKANAQAISALPELLAVAEHVNAVQGVVRLDSFDPDHIQMVGISIRELKKIQSAILKAKGKEQ